MHTYLCEETDLYLRHIGSNVRWWWWWKLDTINTRQAQPINNSFGKIMSIKEMNFICHYSACNALVLTELNSWPDRAINEHTIIAWFSCGPCLFARTGVFALQSGASFMVRSTAVFSMIELLNKHNGITYQVVLEIDFWNCCKTMAPVNAFQMVRFFCCACGFWNVCKYEPCGENEMAATPATRSLRTSLPVSQAYTVTASGVITANLLPSSLNLAELHVTLQQQNPILSTQSLECKCERALTASLSLSPEEKILLLFLETQNLKRQTEALLHFFAHHWKQKKFAHICGNWIACKNFMGNWSLLTCLLLRLALEQKEVQPTTTTHLAPSLHKTHIHTKSSKMCENQTQLVANSRSM